jgi:hypothetical protein
MVGNGGQLGPAGAEFVFSTLTSIPSVHPIVLIVRFWTCPRTYFDQASPTAGQQLSNVPKLLVFLSSTSKVATFATAS